MEFETIVSVLLGFVVPMAISFTKKAHWPKLAKIALAGAISMATATVSLFIQGQLHSVQDVANNTALIWGVATAFYKMHFAGTDFNIKLEGM